MIQFVPHKNLWECLQHVVNFFYFRHGTFAVVVNHGPEKALNNADAIYFCSCSSELSSIGHSDLVENSSSDDELLESLSTTFNT